MEALSYLQQTVEESLFLMAMHSPIILSNKGWLIMMFTTSMLKMIPVSGFQQMGAGCHYLMGKNLQISQLTMG